MPHFFEVPFVNNVKTKFTNGILKKWGININLQAVSFKKGLTFNILSYLKFPILGPLIVAPESSNPGTPLGTALP